MIGAGLRGLVALLAVVLTGCMPVAPGSIERPVVEPEFRAARQVLDGLPVVPRPRRNPGYRRAAFGPAWADTDGDGCRQRAQSLAQHVDRTRHYIEGRRGRCAGDISAGSWVDPYTGERMTFDDVHDPAQASQIPVDHVVALGSAYRYGADRWSDGERLEFATDLQNLQPTSRSANASKGDRDAAAWRPRHPYQCAYATVYVQIKAKYRLPVDRPERNALDEMLDRC